jgi:hypothetical protein
VPASTHRSEDEEKRRVTAGSGREEGVAGPVACLTIGCVVTTADLGSPSDGDRKSPHVRFSPALVIPGAVTGRTSSTGSTLARPGSHDWFGDDGVVVRRPSTAGGWQLGRPSVRARRGRRDATTRHHYVGCPTCQLSGRSGRSCGRRDRPARRRRCRGQPSTEGPKSSGTASMSTTSVGVPRLIAAPRRTPIRRKPARS